MSGDKRDYRKLLGQLGITTAIMLPVSAAIIIVSLLVFMGRMDSSEKEGTRSSAALIYPWVKFAYSFVTYGGLQNWFILGMGLQFTGYAWIWTVGRFFHRKASDLFLVLLFVHFTGWLLLLMHTPR